MSINIFRPATDTEKADFIELGQQTVLESFLAKLSVKRNEYAKAYKPYDAYCARIDFEEYIRRTIGHLSTIVDKDNSESLIEIPDLDKYGNPDRFILISERDVFEDKLLDGIRNTVKTGKEFNYKGKFKGNGICVTVPIIDLPAVEKRIREEGDNKKPEVGSSSSTVKK